MNRAEPREAAASVLAERWRRRRSGLRATLLGRPQSFEVADGSGRGYHAETEAYRDDRAEGPPHVGATARDGGSSAWLPVFAGFIVAPHGSSVRE